MKTPKWLEPPKSEYEIFKVGKAELNFTGCYIKDYKTWWRYLRGLINTTALGISAVSEYAVAFLLLRKGDLINLFDVLCPSTTMMVTTFKLYVMLWKQKDMQDLFQVFENSFAREVRNKGPSFRTHLPKLGFYLSVFLTITTCATGNSFNVMPLITNVVSMIKGQEPVPELPFKTWWPWEWKQSPVYETMYIYLFYASVLTQIGIPSVDALFLDFYLHVALMFEVISMELKSLVVDVVGDDTMKETFSVEENKKIYEKLKAVMQKHNFCFELSDQVKEVYREIIFVHVLSAAFIICLSSINLILSTGLHKLIFVNYIIAATTQIFFFALAGGLLEEACLDVGVAAYNLPWYKMNKSVRMQVQTVIMRAQKPSIIQVPLVTVSMPLFSSICQAAGSYITLLQSFLDKTK